jgi:hypothetical protein
MAKDELVSQEHWRIFRLFLSELSDDEMDGVQDQLQREQSARRERDASIARLFYSSMCTPDLATAQDEIHRERRGRAEDQRLARESVSRSPAAMRKTRRRAPRTR